MMYEARIRKQSHIIEGPVLVLVVSFVIVPSTTSVRMGIRNGGMILHHLTLLSYMDI